MAQVPLVSDKLRHFAAHRDDFDTLFIGSSRVFRQIDPALFDQVLSEHGIPSHSFNLGVDAMYSPEDLFFCERVLALHPAHLKRVFIESSGFYADFGNQDPGSLRVAYWHDARRLGLLSRLIFSRSSDSSVKRKRRKGSAERWAQVELFSRHLEIFLTRFSNLGRGLEWFEERPGLGAPMDPEVIGAAGDGFVPMRGSLSGATLREYETKREDRLQKGGVAVPPPPSAQRSLDGLFDSLRHSGAQPWTIVSPSLSGRHFHPKGSAGVLDFSDPVAWPLLFENSHRADAGHLNRAGAQIYTRALAERFVDAGAANPH